MRLVAILKRNPAQVFFCEFCKIFKHTYFVEYLQTAASVVIVELNMVIWVNKDMITTLSNNYMQLLCGNSLRLLNVWQGPLHGFGEYFLKHLT